MNNISYIAITDLHLEEQSLEQTSKVVTQSIDEAHKLQVPLYIGGDVFDSRKAQSQTIIDAWSDLIEYANLKNVEIRCIPGNHDKMNYKGESSYLDVYRYHPSFTLIEDYGYFDHNNIRVHMIPFFEEKETYPKYLSKVQYGPNINHLITHIAVDAVRNNDGSVIADTLSVDLFSKFDKVFVGHYHDKQTIKNIYYIGACKQKNYGEDDDKGMLLVDDIGDHMYKQTNFKKYTTVKLDIDNITPKQLQQVSKEYNVDIENIRFKLIGSKQSAAKIDQNKLMQLGIDVKYEYKEEINLIDSKTDNFTGFDKESILKEWDIFTEVNQDIDKIEGVNYLNKLL